MSIETDGIADVIKKLTDRLPEGYPAMIIGALLVVVPAYLWAVDGIGFPLIHEAWPLAIGLIVFNLGVFQFLFRR